MELCIVCTEATARRRGEMCPNCWAAKVLIQRSAASMMALHGITKASGMCVDCGIRLATCRDHRHYSSPLKVDFVCTSCNTKRGAALDLHQLIKTHRGLIAQEADETKPSDTLLDATITPGFNLREYVASIERQTILEALRLTKFNKTAAAKALGITFRSLRYRMEILEIV
jgi:hypothetical protein